ncbi:MAG TPA: hypothetical protein VKP30_06595, partial [Polyangiaceae bacterium]|nr:hypothetical protein [Polyangiaceae bacterium]
EAMETATFSGSLLPAEDPTARTNNRLIALDADVSESDVRHQNGSSSAFKRLGAPFSLPVQAGSHSLLCPRLPEGFSQRSTMLVQRLPREWRNRLLSASRLTDGKALDQLGVTATGAGVFSLMESLYSLPEAPALLCARPGPTMDYLKQVLWKIAERANDESSVKDAVLSDSIRQHVRGRGLPLTSVQEAKALFAHWQSSFELDATALRFGSPAEVWLKAQNGNVYLRSTAVVSANVAALATTPFPDSSAPKRSRARIWAHAETYFACTKSWHECRSDALWRLEWRARLRRVQPYASLLRQAGARPAEPSQLEDTVVNWLERSARPLGPSWRSPRVRGFVPDFEPIPVRDTRTFRSREMSHGRAAEDASLDEFLAREGTANSVIH